MVNQRIQQIQEYMTQEAIDLTLLCLSENIVLAGGNYWPRNGLAFILVSRTDIPVLLVPEMELEDTAETEGFEIRTFGWVRLSAGNAYENIAAVLNEYKQRWNMSDSAVIAFETEPQAIAPALCDGEIILPGTLTRSAVKSVFPKAVFKDIFPCISDLRKIKLIDEQQKIENVNKIAFDGLDYFSKLLDTDEKRTEIQIASSVEAYIAQNANKYGIKYARAWAQVSSGERTAEAWNAGIITGNRVIEKGDLVMIEMGTIADGYFCDLTRTCVCQEADEKKGEMMKAVKEAQRTAVQKVKAGVPAKEIDLAARKVLKGYGWEENFVHGTGHGVGFSYHDGCPVLNPISEDILEEGMIHSVEPGVYIAGIGGVRYEVNVLVTKDGCKILGE